MLRSLVIISTGASAGAILRWALGLALNAKFPALPPGTLAANLVGCYGMGVATAAFASLPGIAPEWRLLIVTGFLGSLTTFSTFAAEVAELLRQGRPLLALAAAALHAGGSLIAVFLGIGSFALIAEAWRHGD